MTSPVHRARPWVCAHLLGCQVAMVASFDQLAGELSPMAPEVFWAERFARVRQTAGYVFFFFFFTRELGYSCAIRPGYRQPSYRACLAEELSRCRFTPKLTWRPSSAAGGLA